MLVSVKDKIVSLDLFKNNFVCNLNACKGACCVEGDAGAPLTYDEIDILEDILEDVKPYMRKEGIEAVEKNGVFYLDTFDEPVTTLVNNKECAFAYFDEHGIAKCAIEKAYNEGKVDFKKPISCHLYPIREKKISTDTVALNYDQWEICDPACKLGEELQVPVYKFLKEAITRAYGADFYQEMEEVAVEIKKSDL